MMKSKNNAQYIAKVLEKGGTATENKFEILRRWHKAELDFKVILGFKNSLWNSPCLDPERNTISMREFERIKSEGEPAIRDGVGGAEALVTRDCALNDSFSLTLFSNLVDLYIYLPAKDLNRDSNRSASMHQVLSGLSKDKATHETVKLTPEAARLQKSMEFIWIRIDERFKHMHAAFRFLDVNYNNSISFAELT